MMPLALMERANSSSASSRNRVRGWNGLGSIRSASICNGAPDIEDSRAGATAVPLGVVECDGVAGVGATGTCGSGSRMSAPSPLPNAFLVIKNYLLCELCVALGPFTVDIVENNRLTETWRFGQPDVSRNHCLENLGSEETPQIRSDLARQCSSLVIHR